MEFAERYEIKRYKDVYFRAKSQRLMEYAKHMDEYDMRDRILDIICDQTGSLRIKFPNKDGWDCYEIHFSTYKKGKYVLSVIDRDHSDEIRLEKKGLFKRKFIYKGYHGEFVW